MVKSSEHIIKACISTGAHEKILDFIEEYGFGNYGNGILKLINPEDQMDNCYKWLWFE